jgi:hypothetical protein
MRYNLGFGMTGRECRSGHQTTSRDGITDAIYVTNHCSYARKSCSATGNDTDVLVRVLACLSLTIAMIVKPCNGLAKG